MDKNYYSIKLNMFLQFWTFLGTLSQQYEINSLDGCPLRPKNWKAVLGSDRCARRCKQGMCKRMDQVCLCDGECGTSCIDTEMRCESLLDVPNGWSQSPSDFTFRSVVRYDCKPGFHLDGSAKRICQGNGRWSGTHPVCKPSAVCKNAPRIPYAAHSHEGQSDFDLETVITYHCLEGYYRVNEKGLARAKCIIYNGTARWFGPDIRCTARHCGFPGDPNNGKKTGDVHLFQHKVRFECFPGYYLLGSSFRECLANGRWSGHEPTCKPKTCPRPDDIANGRVRGGSLEYQTRITYQCDKGYRLIGQSTRVCQADQKWSDQQPFCEEIRCPSVGRIWNGYVEGEETSVGSTIVFHCNADTTFVGVQRYSTCEKDGTWSNPPPQCFAKCVVPDVDNGHEDKHRENTLLPHGEAIKVICENNYEVDYPKFPDCRNGTWSFVPRCVPIRCKTWPPAVRDGMAVFLKTDHNSLSRYECDPGYQLSGNKTIRCQYGQWVGKPPVCKQSLCPNALNYFGQLSNGKIMLEGQMGVYEFTKFIRGIKDGRRILFECEKRFVLRGPPKATCVNGVWQPMFKPRCIPQLYPEIEDQIIWEQGLSGSSARKKHRKRMLRSAQKLGLNSSAVDDLNLNQTTNIQLEGRTAHRHRRKYSRLKRKGLIRSVTKGQSQSRDQLATALDQDPYMRRRLRKLGTDYNGVSIKGDYCPQLIDTRRQQVHYFNGEPLANGSVPHNAEVRVDCKHGFELADPMLKTVKCINGTWDLGLPKCLPRRCDLPTRENAFFVHGGEISAPRSKIRHNNGAQMLCLKEYDLIGNDELECNLGQFLRPAGICSPKSCSLPVLRYGYYIISDLPVNVTHGKLIKFACKDGTHAHPASGEVYCWFGQFRSDVPQCVAETLNETASLPDLTNGCDRPVDIEHAWVYRPITAESTAVATLINKEQSVYPNKTIVHYKCASTPDLPDNDSEIYGPELMEAKAVQCIDGEWIALLLDCASITTPPFKVADDDSLSKLNRHNSEHNCQEPMFVDEVVVIGQSENAFRMKGVGYSPETVLQVRCMFDDSQQRSWAVTCNDGQWDNLNSIACSKFTTKQCPFSARNFSNDLLIFDVKSGIPLTSIRSQLKPGTKLVFRCRNVGLFRLVGSKVIQCAEGFWTSSVPVCQSLTESWKLYDKPAPIVYHAERGDLAVTNSGSLVARVSSTVHFDCLVPRKGREPEWITSNSYRNYPKFWTNNTASVILPEETGLSILSELSAVYRLSIYNARPEDSGQYTCVSPMRQRHSLQLLVKDIECRKLWVSSDNHLRVVKSSRKNRIGSEVLLECEDGYKLSGPSRIFCLSSGKWSESMPTCLPVTCPTIEFGHVMLSANISSYQFRGHVKFECGLGYTLDGPPLLYCLEHGEWSDPVPSCKPVTCSPPDVPSGTRIAQDSTKRVYMYSDTVAYECAESGLLLQGNRTAYCGHSGIWSNPAPDCKTICHFPGKPKHGFTNVPALPHYQTGQRISFYCSAGLVLTGASTISCHANGQWSAPVPRCSQRWKRSFKKSKKRLMFQWL